MLTTACSIKDNAGELAEGYVAENDTETLKAFRRREAQDAIADGDIASGAYWSDLFRACLSELTWHRR